MKYLVLYTCELAPRERKFESHRRYFHTYDEALKSGANWVTYCENYPMCGAYQIYKETESGEYELYSFCNC